MIRWSKLFVPLCLIVAGVLVPTIITAKKTPPPQQPVLQASTISAPLNVSALTDNADLVVIGTVSAIWEEGSTTIKSERYPIHARQMTALLNVKSTLKGRADNSTLNFNFFITEMPVGYRGIPTDQILTFFLRETSPQEYALLDPHYPFIVASEGVPPADGRPLDKIVANLAQLLVTQDTPVENRMEAIRALKSVRTEAATAALRQGTEEQNASVRLEAAAALLNRNDISALDMVTKSLAESSQDVNDSVREDVIYALDGIKDPKAAPALARLLTMSDVRIRCGAAAALRHTDSPEAASALAGALDDNDQQVRYSAVAGLAEFTGEREGMPSIELFKKNERHYLTHWHERAANLKLTQRQ